MKTPVVLFLNKDLLEEKIKSGRNPVSNYFPDCPGDDYETVEKYFRELFLAQNPNPEARNIYPHVTSSNDKLRIKVVETAVQVAIIDETLSKKLKPR